MLKKIFRPLHLIVGLISGLVIMTVSITGCITSFDENLKNVVYSDLYEVNASFKKAKSLDELVVLAQKFHPKKDVKSIRIRPEKTSSLEVNFKDKESVYLNPYTGKVLGSLNRESEFFAVVLEIHKNLYLDELGETITGISVLVFFFMLVSGIVLWWPKRGTPKSKVSFLEKMNWRKRSYDLHRVLGFYASWIIIFTVLTGLVWSFDWAEDTMYWMTGSKKSPRMEVESTASNSKTSATLDVICAKAKAKFPTFKNCFVNFPEDEKGTYRVMFRYPNKGFYRKQDNLFFDQYTGKIVGKKYFSELTSGDKLKMTNENIHTGKVLGLVGQLLVFFASLICASLPITGFLIWWGKRKK